jgi:aspartate oxidase
MIELNVVQTYLEQDIFNFSNFEAERFPGHMEDILLILNGYAYKCNVNRTASQCRISVLADGGNGNLFNEVLNNSYSVGDIICFKRFYDEQGIVRILIIENN